MGYFDAGAVPVMEAIGVTKSYGGRRALDDCSLICRKGEAMAIMGPNGAGKSTLLKVMAGLIRPDQGKVMVGTLDLHHIVPDARIHISYLGHETALYDDLTVQENLVYSWRLLGRSREDAISRCRTALEAFGLAHRANDRAAVLSAGMRRRAALARNLHDGRACLLLDEPFANLDEQGRQVLRNALITHLKEEGCALIVIHDAALLEGVPHRVLHLEEGRVMQ